MGTKATNVSTTEAPAKELSNREKFRQQPVLLLVKTNPKKNPSMSYDRFENYFKLDYSDKLPTVKQALDAGVRMDDIRHDSEHGFIAVGEKAIEEARAKIEADRKAEIERARELLAEVDSKK